MLKNGILSIKVTGNFIFDDAYRYLIKLLWKLLNDVLLHHVTSKLWVIFFCAHSLSFDDRHRWSILCFIDLLLWLKLDWIQKWIDSHWFSGEDGIHLFEATGLTVHQWTVQSSLSSLYLKLRFAIAMQDVIILHLLDFFMSILHVQDLIHLPQLIIQIKFVCGLLLFLPLITLRCFNQKRF